MSDSNHKDATQPSNDERSEKSANMEDQTEEYFFKKKAIPHPISTIGNGLNRKNYLGIFGVIAMALTLLLGSMHVVNGSTYKGSKLVPKLSFGFSETFINADAILGMPYIVAKSQLPLSVLALQRVGYLETEAQMQKRIDAELKVEMDKIQAEVDQELRKSEAEFQAALEKLVRQ